jgi:hypothetical protein
MVSKLPQDGEPNYLKPLGKEQMMAKKRVGSRIFLGTVCGLLGACGTPSVETPEVPLAQPQPAMPMRVQVLHGRSSAPTMSVVAPQQPVVASSVDEVAWATLRGLKEGHKLSDSAIASAKLREIHDAGNGPLLARFEQEVDGLPVFLRSVNIAMDRNMQPKLASGRLATQLRKVSDRFQLDESVAVESALRVMSGSRGSAQSMSAAVAAPGGYSKRQLVAQLSDSGAKATVSSRSRRVYFPTDNGLLPAYYIELDVAPEDSTNSYARSFVVSAVDGKILFEKNLSEDAAYTYRVYADGAPGFVPWDGAQGNAYSPYPKAAPDGSAPTFQPGTLVTLENVPFRRNDPWLPEGATELSGNNGWTYVDQTAPDGYTAGDLLVRPTAGTTFDRSFDLNTTKPSANDTAKLTVATNLFYVINYLHDTYYDAGWTESAQNPQKANYGRGGVEGDAIRLEAQDNGGRNNANASTPADGGMPRIQMYLWDAAHSALRINAPAGLAGNLDGRAAPYGAGNYNLTNTVVALADAPGAGGSTTDGCDAGHQCCRCGRQDRAHRSRHLHLHHQVEERAERWCHWCDHCQQCCGGGTSRHWWNGRDHHHSDAGHQPRRWRQDSSGSGRLCLGHDDRSFRRARRLTRRHDCLARVGPHPLEPLDWQRVRPDQQPGPQHGRRLERLCGDADDRSPRGQLGQHQHLLERCLSDGSALGVCAG